MKPAAILDRAADLMLEHGLARGDYVDDDGHLCTMGAIYAAIAGSTNHDDVIYEVVSKPEHSVVSDRVAAGFVFEEIRAQRNRAMSIANWNDHIAKDKEEAALMLRYAAKRAEAEGQ